MSRVAETQSPIPYVTLTLAGCRSTMPAANCTDSTLLVSYGVSACLCAQRHVCVDDVLRLLDRRLAIATL